MSGRSEAVDDARADPGASAPVGSAAQRARTRLIAALAWVVCRLPEGLVLGTADLVGSIAYRALGERREQARRNLRRVAEWAAAAGESRADVRAAATDPGSLDGLVREAFRQHARYWVELIRAPLMSADYIRERVDIRDMDVLDAALAPGGPVAFIGLHFGAIELPAFYLAQVAHREAVGPMQSVADPALQRWFVGIRGLMGVRLVGLREARRELVAALRAGQAVGLVADRDLTGGGIDTPFFGHLAPLPAGPALLVLETGTPAVAVAVRRTRDAHYIARLADLPAPPEGSRRARAEAFLATEARTFERLIADAPEQWWAVFFPIWPDLAMEERAA
jgi:lauroyl/myristoyl acyltransferase